MAAKSKHGGTRPGAGAKRKQDKKQAVFIYIPASHINLFGGKPTVKAFAEAAINRKVGMLQK